MQQYFPGSISSAFEGSEKLPGSAPAIVSQGDIEGLITTLASQEKFAKEDLASTVFNFMLPQGTVLNDNPGVTASLKRSVTTAEENPIPHDDEDDSLRGLGGYHGSVHNNGVTIYYAVGVDSKNPGRWDSERYPSLRQVMEERRRNLLPRIERGPNR